MTHRPEVDDTDRLLTVTEVADFLSVSPRTVQRYVADGRLAAVVLPSGRGLRFRRTDLDALAGAA